MVKLDSYPTLRNKASLVAYYKLENVNDEIASKNLTNTNSVTFTAARFNNGATFTATNQDLRYASTLSLSMVSFSVSFQARITSAHSGAERSRLILQDASSGSNQVEYACFYAHNNNNPRIELTRYRYGFGEEFNTSQTITGWNVDEDHYIAIKHDGSYMDVFLDGTRILHVSSGGVGNTGSDNIFLLGPASSGAVAKSKIDDLAFWSEPLTDTEISDYAAYTPQNYTKSLSENISLSESINKSVGKQNTDNPVINDQLSSESEFKIERSEAVNLLDALSKAVGSFKTENPGVTDANEKSIGKIREEILALTDSSLRSSGKNISDNPAVSDIGFVLTIGKNISELLDITDSVALAVAFNQVISENLPLSDAVNVVSGYYLALADNPALNDQIEAIKQFYRNLIEQVNLADSPAITIGKTLADMIQVSDFVTLVVGKMIAEDVSLADSIMAQIEYSKNISENILIVESLKNSVGKNLSDSSDVSDSVSSSISIKIQDAVTVVETLVRGYDLNLSEALAVVDSIQRSLRQSILKKSVIPRTREKTVITNKNKDKIILISSL